MKYLQTESADFGDRDRFVAACGIALISCVGHEYQIAHRNDCVASLNLRVSRMKQSLRFSDGCLEPNLVISKPDGDWLQASASESNEFIKAWPEQSSMTRC